MNQFFKLTEAGRVKISKFLTDDEKLCAEISAYKDLIEELEALRHEKAGDVSGEISHISPASLIYMSELYQSRDDITDKREEENRHLNVAWEACNERRS